MPSIRILQKQVYSIATAIVLEFWRPVFRQKTNWQYFSKAFDITVFHTLNCYRSWGLLVSWVIYGHRCSLTCLAIVNVSQLTTVSPGLYQSSQVSLRAASWIHYFSLSMLMIYLKWLTILQSLNLLMTLNALKQFILLLTPAYFKVT